MTDPWDPGQYERFHAERELPFRDLLTLVQPAPGGLAVDLGCGTGELTREVHRHVGAAQTMGVDRSTAMLDRAKDWASAGLRFEPGDLGDFGADGPPPRRYDVVFSNAALHWVGDHRHVLRNWAGTLGSGGQLAVHVPAVADQPNHALVFEVSREPQFADAFGPDGPPSDPVLSVLKPEEYATLLDEIGFEHQHVRLQVYAHRLASTDEVVEWTKGSTLTVLRRVMAPGAYNRLVARFTERVFETYGDRRPCFFPFKRILLWGRMPS